MYCIVSTESGSSIEGNIVKCVLKTIDENLPPVHGTGADAVKGQTVPARHAVQLNFAPPSEYIPAGQGTFDSLQNGMQTEQIMTMHI